MIMGKVEENAGLESDVKPKIENEENSPNNKFIIRAKKRKRIDSDTSTDGDDVLPENTLEMERNLHASAIKNNLDDVSVKKILKKVVTNDHVLALVKLREEEEDSGTEESQPKLTRAKAKELMKVSRSHAPWNLELTPIKHIPVKTRPEVEALIAQELPEDEDDEEYEPTHDDVPSDDDHILESCSDLDSQPRTPATPQSQKRATPKFAQDGPFKVPQEIKTDVCRKLKLEQDDEATIALRTRSKLSLSGTPIEHIESSFVPPDDIPPVNDDLWNDFLKDCLNPVSNSRNEDDDDADPEYNVAADPDANEEDEEALENSLIKISKKELNDLVAELFSVMPAESDVALDEIQGALGGENNTEVPTVWEGKQEPLSEDESKMPRLAAKIQYERRTSLTRFSIGKNEIEDASEDDTHMMENKINTKKVSEYVVKDNVLVPVVGSTAQPDVSSKVTVTVEEHEQMESSPAPPPALRALLQPAPVTVCIQVDESVQMYPEQVQILQQQLRQHIQLAASNFLQLFVHPLHWTYGPKNKEYLVSLNKMAQANSKSVVDVCNLKPAVELVESWESTMSENTQETAAMVEFIRKEVERCRKRNTQNSVYIGEFPDLFKKVVANSPVFLYPYLLPPVPYRADFKHKRFSYLRSEDELIVLGLDQFWWYIENNPKLFKQPARPHPRRRWGLATAARLVCRHMLPGLTPRALLSHIHTARKGGSKDSAIVNYFLDGTIVPVKHKLLPFNPKLTLYEQPEFEMPKIWIKYLAKNSKRFRDHLHRRSSQAPAGIDVEMGTNVEPLEKNPLPIDFIKHIPARRTDALPPTTQQVLQDKVDVHIQRSDQNCNAPLLLSTIYTVINTSLGTHLIPLQVQTSTVNSAFTPICTPSVINAGGTDGKEMNDKSDTDTTKDGRTEDSSSIHCKCCNLFKKIRRKRQTYITDYFNNKKSEDKICGCGEKKYPKISNKLKILINNFKNISINIYKLLLTKIEGCKNNCDKFNDCETKTDDRKDLVSAILFQIKLMERMSIARNSKMKHALHTAITRYHIDHDDPLDLTEKLYKIFNVDLIDMYKEFLGFLTAEQAEKIDQFKDYFVRNCVEDLVAKVEELVSDQQKRQIILEKIRDTIVDNISRSCDMCYELLNCSQDYPILAQYIYSLFPHRRREQKETVSNSETANNVQNGKQQEAGNRKEADVTMCEEPNATVDYEADNSSSDEDSEEVNKVEAPINEPLPNVQKPDSFVTTSIKYEDADPSEMKIEETAYENNESSDGMSMLVMSEDEAIKTETHEWKRGEDKLILEVIKQCLSLEDIKDKTIIEIINDKNLVNTVSERLPQKALEDIRRRLLYLLGILVNEK